jgi:hypothetical protein
VESFLERSLQVTRIADVGAPGNVTAVTCTLGKLVITVTTEANDVHITFENVVGYRVFDEADLLEFWPACSSRHPTIFEVHEGGWKQQESLRQGFLSAVSRPMIREFFITGADDCVNVLALEGPLVNP